MAGFSKPKTNNGNNTSNDYIDSDRDYEILTNDNGDAYVKWNEKYPQYKPKTYDIDTKYTDYSESPTKKNGKSYAFKFDNVNGKTIYTDNGTITDYFSPDYDVSKNGAKWNNKTKTWDMLNREFDTNLQGRNYYVDADKLAETDKQNYIAQRQQEAEKEREARQKQIDADRAKKAKEQEQKEQEQKQKVQNAFEYDKAYNRGVADTLKKDRLERIKNGTMSMDEFLTSSVFAYPEIKAKDFLDLAVKQGYTYEEFIDELLTKWYDLGASEKTFNKEFEENNWISKFPKKSTRKKNTETESVNTIPTAPQKQEQEKIDNEIHPPKKDSYWTNILYGTGKGKTEYDDKVSERIENLKKANTNIEKDKSLQKYHKYKISNLKSEIDELLSNEDNYKYSEAQVRKMLNEIIDEVEAEDNIKWTDEEREEFIQEELPQFVGQERWDNSRTAGLFLDWNENRYYTPTEKEAIMSLLTQISKNPDEYKDASGDLDKNKVLGFLERIVGDKEDAINMFTELQKEFEEDIQNLHKNELSRIELAKAEKLRKNKEFWENNPSIANAIFGKDSGYNLKERAVMLGSVLANLGSNIANAYSAGVRGQGYDYKKSRLQNIFEKAQDKSLERMQTQFDSANKAKVDKEEILSRINNTVYLSQFTDRQKEELATIMGGAKLDSNEFEKRFGLEDKSVDELEKIYTEYVNTHDMWETVLNNQGKALDNDSKAMDLQDKQFRIALSYLNSEQDIDEYIQKLSEAKIEMKRAIAEIRASQSNDYFSYVERYLGYLAGIESASNSLSNGSSVSDSFSANAGVNVGFGPVGVSAGISNTSSSSSSNSNTAAGQQDLLRRMNLDVAETSAENWANEVQKYKQPVIDALENQVKILDQQIENAKSRKARLSKNKPTSVNDGIIKAPKMKQWLQREDGTRIELNPNDNVYATLNPITTDKDNNKDVVPLEQEDKVVIIQKKLGHKGMPINKQFDYYMSKLRG